MFDISWTEFLLVGVVALIVIGPKELPAVLRTLGQYTRKVRGMAADFQNQFQEAMREAEMTDLKKQVDDLAHDFKHFDPLKGVRDDVEGAGRDIKSSLEGTPSVDPSTERVESTVSAETAAEAAAALPEPGRQPADEFPLPEAAVEQHDADSVGAATEPVAPEAAEATVRPNSTERLG